MWIAIFFCNDSTTTEIYTRSLHDALPICQRSTLGASGAPDHQPATRTARRRALGTPLPQLRLVADRKSTRLNSSHANISYAVFCLKKNKIIICVIQSYTHPSVHQVITCRR